MGQEIRNQTVEADSEADAQRLIREKTKCHVTEVRLVSPPLTEGAAQFMANREAEQSESEKYPGVGVAFVVGGKAILKDIPFVAIIGLIFGVVFWILAKVFTFNPDFWFTIRWTTIPALVLLVVIDIIKCWILGPLAINAKAKRIGVPFGMAWVAIQHDYFEETPPEEQNAEHLKEFVFIKQTAQRLAASAMTHCKR